MVGKPRHKNKHDVGPKFYKCDICKKEFLLRKDIRKHVQKDHNITSDQDNVGDEGASVVSDSYTSHDLKPEVS